MIAAGIVLSIILENIVGSGFPYFLLASCAKRTSSRVEEQKVWYKQTNKQNLRNSISKCLKHVTYTADWVFCALQIHKPRLNSDSECIRQN